MLGFGRLCNPSRNGFKNKLEKYPLGKVPLDLILLWSQGIDHSVFQSFDLHQTLWWGRRAKVELLWSNQDSEHKSNERPASVLIHGPCNVSYLAWRQGPSLSYLLFPRGLSWFRSARGRSLPKLVISQYISHFRQPSNHLTTVLHYSFITNQLCVSYLI